MKTLLSFLGCVFGYMMLAFSVIVTIEVIGRKFFGFSLQGADELGGYTLAVGSSIGFSGALIERAHIRVDLLYEYLPSKLRNFMNWLSSVLMACLSLMIVMVSYSVIVETITYGSVAPSPWATPLIYPQMLWFICLVIFAILAVLFAIHATILLMQRRVVDFDAAYGPRNIEKELQGELGAFDPQADGPAGKHAP